VRAALARPDYRWLPVPTPHFDLYVQVGSPSDIHRSEVAAAAEHALATDLAAIDAPAYPNRIQLLFVTSRAQMREIVGRPAGGFALVEPGEGGDAGVFVGRPSDGLGALRHEIMHLVTYKQWGEPVAPTDWIVEGTATWAVGTCAGYAFDPLAARLLADGRLPTLDALVHHFDDVDNLNAYLASASLVQYFRERNGVPTLRAIWRQGLAGALAALGATPASAEAAWRTYLRTRVTPAPARAWDDIRTRGCEG
jgi:hypothetical protein